MRTLSYSTQTVIHRSAEDVFDYCSELQWDPKVKYGEKLTDGPVGVGTRYRAQWANRGPTAVEGMPFDRPRRRETHTTARGMDIRFQGTVSDAAQGARYNASWSSNRCLARLVAALALLAMRRQDQQDMHRIREALESTTGDVGLPARPRRTGSAECRPSGRVRQPEATTADRGTIPPPRPLPST
jgi:hypothetical protein